MIPPKSAFSLTSGRMTAAYQEKVDSKLEVRISYDMFYKFHTHTHFLFSSFQLFGKIALDASTSITVNNNFRNFPQALQVLFR